jgi:hypothetical protein
MGQNHSIILSKWVNATKPVGVILIRVPIINYITIIFNRLIMYNYGQI